MITDMIGTDTFSVQLIHSLKNASGGTTPSYTAVYTNINGRLEDLQASEQMVFAQRDMIVTHRIFTTQSGINLGHRIVWSDGKIFLVREVSFRRQPTRTTRLRTFYVILAEEQRRANF